LKDPSDLFKARTGETQTYHTEDFRVAQTDTKTNANINHGQPGHTALVQNSANQSAIGHLQSGHSLMATIPNSSLSVLPTIARKIRIARATTRDIQCSNERLTPNFFDRVPQKTYMTGWAAKRRKWAFNGSSEPCCQSELTYL
jgi:hypothetical protein